MGEKTLMAPKCAAQMLSSDCILIHAFSIFEDVCYSPVHSLVGHLITEGNPLYITLQLKSCFQ